MHPFTMVGIFIVFIGTMGFLNHIPATAQPRPPDTEDQRDQALGQLGQCLTNASQLSVENRALRRQVQELQNKPEAAQPAKK